MSVSKFYWSFFLEFHAYYLILIKKLIFCRNSSTGKILVLQYLNNVFILYPTLQNSFTDIYRLIFIFSLANYSIVLQQLFPSCEMSSKCLIILFEYNLSFLSNNF